MDAAEYLQSLSPRSLEYRLARERQILPLFRKRRRGVSVRLHRLFQKTPAAVLDALIRYLLKNDKSAKPLLRKAAHLYFSSHRIAPDLLEPSGSTYDLRPIYEKIKERFFTPGYDAAIGWSAVFRRGNFRHITFGTYDRHRHQIRIHPLLDHPEVPLYFLEFIVYHEMLHAVCPAEIDARGHCRSHTKEFRRREKLFPQYAEAKEWGKKSLTFFKRKSHGRS